MFLTTTNGIMVVCICMYIIIVIELNKKIRKKEQQKQQVSKTLIHEQYLYIEEKATNKMYNMFLQAIIICMPLIIDDTIGERKKGWGLVGNPLLQVHPCKGNDDISVSFEPGLPPGEENQYNVFINENVPKHTVVIVKFDSQATVTLPDPTKSRISSRKDEFTIRFFDKSDDVIFHVNGRTNSTVPYIRSININTVEYCENPQTGYLDSYIEGYKDTAETHLTVPDDSCGRRKVDLVELITNGLVTKPGDWPWHVAIYRLERATVKYICGGTLLSKNIVVTAAHCATIRGVPVLPEILSVVLGKYNLIGGDLATQEREVHEIIVHDEFSYTKHLDNDVALLKLRSEAMFNDYVQPACLWSASVQKKLPPGTISGTVVGWGFDQTEELSTQLKQATIPKVSELTCIKSNPVFFGKTLNNRKFCAGFNNGTSACNGDSGGGFHVFIPDTAGDTTSNATGAWHVRGIVSLSVARRDAAICDTSQYVLFTDLAKFRGWLLRYVK